MGTTITTSKRHCSKSQGHRKALQTADSSTGWREWLLCPFSRQGPGEEGARWVPAGRASCMERERGLPGGGKRKQSCPRPSTSPPTSPFPHAGTFLPNQTLCNCSLQHPLPTAPNTHTGLCLLFFCCLTKPFPHIPQGPAKCPCSTKRHLPCLKAHVPHLSSEAPP